ncbi:TfoX family protein [Candidatus Woesearchaeota archaeon]|nr:MAG: TfoX family protein [Candidatus Woesearchaeota archaeon]
MAYDEKLAERIRKAVKSLRGIDEKKMFGGIAFLLHGKMFVGITKDELLARVGPENNEPALKKPHTRPMDFTGKPMKGFIYVAPAGIKTDKQLKSWIEMAKTFVQTLKK